ncbi:LCP family protein [Ammoniphilus resinae]|uniref:LCP family protein required for cell wall assembly n=1 Tax=Ammoniphilus resinae TaxID=861532 RepID=A0ABS4GVL8_9BACL|nr:LCP family protein [Ammoniphilus resinae]MBP1933925.1 LCP family protein required for cell wall assembly [Ammoniphilus resinae]
MQTQLNRQQRYAKSGKNKPKKKWMKWALLCLVLLVATGAGAVWWEFDDLLNKVTVSTEPGTSDENPVAKEYNQEPISVVILGKDTREGLGMLNTDVIIVAALNPKTKHVTMMSIPRDTGVQIEGYSGWHKINSVYAKGESERRTAERNKQPVTETGISLLKKTIEGAVGIPIQHYVTVDFEGFTSVIDKLGGVEIDVEKSMRYDDPHDGTHINLDEGLQTLGGKEALGYVRHRLDNRGPKYYSNDFDRGRRQQAVIKAVVDKMKSFSGISSFFGVMEVAGDHIRTDLSKEQIKGLIYDFKSVGSENIASIETGGYWDRASSHTIIPKENMEQIQSAFHQEMGITGTDSEGTFREEPARASQPTQVRQTQPKAVEPVTPEKPKEPTKEAAEKTSNEQGQADPTEKLDQPTPDNDGVTNESQPEAQTPAESNTPKEPVEPVKGQDQQNQGGKTSAPEIQPPIVAPQPEPLKVMEQ